MKNALLLNGMFDDAEEKLFREKIFSADDIELWKGKVLHVERSARNKAHIDIRIPVGMTIAEAQSAFCKLIHATEDPSCVTPSASSSSPMQPAKSILPTTGTSAWTRRPWQNIVRLIEREDWISTAVRWIFLHHHHLLPLQP